MKPKIIKRAVKHVFTPDEIATLSTEFRQAYSNLKAVETEFDSVKASYKAKTTEAESRMETLSATLQAGFDIRDQDCVVVYDYEAGKKHFFLAAQLEYWSPEDGMPTTIEPVITEPMTDKDRQQELIQAEAAFEARTEIKLFEPAGNDQGVMVVGRLDGKWFSALRVTIGQHEISERLDGDGPGSKKRYDQVKRGLKQFDVWLETNLGREEAKGFRNAIELVKVEQAEREE